VEKEEYQYYLYEAKCDTCSIIIALSSFGNGNPDLYINYGDESLPTLRDNHISRSTLKSEVAIINLENAFFYSRNIKSMRGRYIIGVYGREKSSYQISITSESYPITLIYSGLAI